MSTTSSERGLSLRSPGRFISSAGRRVAIHSARLGRGDARTRDEINQVKQAFHPDAP
jgi:hypothetical protein